MNAVDLPALDGAALDVIERARVARIATVSRTGRPLVNPLYFAVVDGHVWLGTSEWTLAARNAAADARVQVLFEVELDPGDRRLVRLTGTAEVRTERDVLRRYSRRAAVRYILTPRHVWSALCHPRAQLRLHDYHAQGRLKGGACVIDVTPLAAEVLAR